MDVGFYVLSSRLKIMTINGHGLTMNWSDLLLICVPEELDNGFEQNMLPSNRAAAAGRSLQTVQDFAAKRRVCLRLNRKNLTS